MDEQWEKRLVERGEPDVPLELDAPGPQYHPPLGRRRGRHGVQQRGLPHPRISGQEQRPAANRRLPEKALQETKLLGPAGQIFGRGIKMAH